MMEEENPYAQFVEDDAIPENATPTSGETNPYAQFVTPPTQDENPYAQFAAPPPAQATGGDEPAKPEVEGAFARGVRNVANAIAPTVAGLAAAPFGAAAGALTSPVTGPVGPFVGGAGAYMAGAAAGEYAQSKVKSLLGLNDDTQMAVNAEAHPYETAAEQMAVALATMSPGKGLQAGQRLFSGAAMGGLSAVQEYANTGKVDPVNVAMGAAAGAAFPHLNKLGKAISAPSEAAAGAVAFRPGRPDEASPTKPVDAADVNAANDVTPVAGGQAAVNEPAPNPKAPNDLSQVAGSKVEAEGAVDGSKAAIDKQPTQVSTGDVDPTIAAALQATTPVGKVDPNGYNRPEAVAARAARDAELQQMKSNRVEPGEPPTEYGAKLDAQFPKVEVPAEQQRPLQRATPQAVRADAARLAKLRAQGDEASLRLADVFEAAPEAERVKLRARMNQDLRPIAGKRAFNDLGVQTTPARAEKENSAIAAIHKAYDEHPPKEGETNDELRDRLNAIIDTAYTAHGERMNLPPKRIRDPLNKVSGYQPASYPPEFKWYEAAQKLAKAKNPTDQAIEEFKIREKDLRTPGEKLEEPLDSAVAANGRGGDVVEGELAKNPGTAESHETTALENAYNERHKATMKELDDYFNGEIDHENLSPKARKILDDMPKDVRKSAFEANEPGADPAHESKVMDWLRETFDPKSEAEPKATGNAAKPILSLPAAAKASVIKSAPIPANVGAAAHQGAGGGGQPPAGGPPAAGAAGAGQPPPPNIAHVPPIQRGKFNEFLRDIKRKFAPQTLGPLAKEAAHDVRESRGVEQRAAEQTTGLLQKHEGTIKSMAPADREAMIDHIEGGHDFPNWQPTTEQKSFMDDFRQAMQTWEAKLRALPTASQMTFKDDYLSHYYQNNPQAGSLNFGGYGRRGSAGSTQKRKFDTVQDAKRAGLTPLTDNPIEIGARYINSIKDFVAHQNLVQRGLDTGNVGYFRGPKVIGASGSPQPHVTGGPPPGWKALTGVAEKNDRAAFAAPDYADVVNNFYDRGFLQNDPTGQKVGLYHVLRNSNNAWTQLELGLNGYHFFTMANEAFIHNIARGVGKTAAGDVAGGLGTIVKSPGAPLTLALEGRQFQKSYMDPNSTDPVAMIAAEANARPVGKGHAADYTFEQRGSFLKHFDVTNLQSEFKRAFNTIKSDVSGDFAKAFGANGTLSDKLSFPFKQASRALATTAAPLFDHYVPLLKAGAVHSQFKDWHAAMERKNPAFDMVNSPADRRTAVDAMSKIVDTVDNRFGEMIQDNMFMDAKIKQSALVAMRSFSWTVGTMKEIGGGTYALGKGLKGLAQGQNKFNMTHPEWDPRAAYPIALTMGVSVLSAVYQALLGSHDAPEGWRDLYAPRTGGTVPGVGQKGQVREHVLMPGYQKDVLGYLTHPMQEAYGKLGGLPTTAIEVAGNKDWRGDPITKPGASMMEAMGQRAAHVFSKLGPISIKNMTKGSEPDSKIGIFQKALGFHAPGSQIQDPERLDQVMNGPRSKDARLWKAKEKRERIQDARQNPAP